MIIELITKKQGVFLFNFDLLTFIQYDKKYLTLYFSNQDITIYLESEEEIIFLYKSIKAILVEKASLKIECSSFSIRLINSIDQ